MAAERVAKDQIEILEGGGKVEQETHLYNAETNTTRSMRSKEDAHDYRYFPDPDLLPLELHGRVCRKHPRQTSRAARPEARPLREADYGLKDYDAALLASDAEKSAYFEAVAKGRDARLAANWVTQELFSYLNKEGLELGKSPVSADQLGGLIELIANNTISGKIAKDVFQKMILTGDSAIGDRRPRRPQAGHRHRRDRESHRRRHRRQPETGRSRSRRREPPATKSPRLLGWFVGQIMKASGGKANPAGGLNEILREEAGALATAAAGMTASARESSRGRAKRRLENPGPGAQSHRRPKMPAPTISMTRRTSAPVPTARLMATGAKIVGHSAPNPLRSWSQPPNFFQRETLPPRLKISAPRVRRKPPRQKQLLFRRVPNRPYNAAHDSSTRPRNLDSASSLCDQWIASTLRAPLRCSCPTSRDFSAPPHPTPDRRV